MFQLLQYYGKWEGFRARLSKLPAWGRFLVGLAGLPGAILALLSLLALVVSILALFIPARVVYRLVSWMSGADRRGELNEPLVEGGLGPVPPSEAPSQHDVAVSMREGVVTVEAMDEQPRPRRQIEVKIVE